jgi:hypothetical protein
LVCGVQVIKQDPSDVESKKTLAKMMPEVERRREKMKDEMMGVPPFCLALIALFTFT